MHRPRISAIAAIGRNRELGKGNELIWRIRDDLKRVKALTMGHPLIMGRKTYESIGRALPGRTNIVITSDETYASEGTDIAHSLDEAFEKATAIDTEEIFIFGGSRVFEEALPVTDRLYLTWIDAEDADATTFFPVYAAFTQIIAREVREHDGLRYEWLTLERPDHHV